MAEAAIVGRPPGREAAIEAGRLARESADPANDLHASADFRLHLVESLTRRAVEAAFARAGREAA
jgi:CO/xanthine dehydrogenase FAD-binding subunit